MMPNRFTDLRAAPHADRARQIVGDAVNMHDALGNPFLSAAPPAAVSVADTLVADTSAGAAYGASAAFIPSSPAPGASPLSTDERDPVVKLDLGAGETFRIPPGFVLVERELLGRVVKRLRQAAERERQELLEPLPGFLRDRPLHDIADGMMRRSHNR